MTKKTLLLISAAVATLAWGTTQGQAATGPVAGVNYDLPNYANTPVLRKFVDSLPGLTAAGSNNLGQYIPVAVADTTAFAGSAYYEIALVQYTEQMHSDMGPTTLRGYVQVETPAVLAAMAAAVPPQVSAHYALPNGLFGVDKPHYLGPLILAQRAQATRVKFYNLLPVGSAGDLFIPTDTTLMGAGMGPDMVTPYTQNRATLHLHGGDNPWVSDGTAHQWVAPMGETNKWLTGASQQNVPDMPIPSQGSATFYWPNGMSGRLMFYHDHAYGMTRLDVYAGEAAGYLLKDTAEENVLAAGGVPGTLGTTPDLAHVIPLVIQDKTFVSDGTRPAGFPLTAPAPLSTLAADPHWADNPVWGQTKGSLWFPHVYIINQDPTAMSGANPMGRWDYGPWFWPVFPVTQPLPLVSSVPESFCDTPVVNGTAYPYANVLPQPYRLRILNACNDRHINLQLYVADPMTVAVVAGGSNYSAGTTVAIAAPGAGGTAALASAAVNAGVILSITVTNAGLGYTNGEQPVVTITDPAATGSGALAFASAMTDVRMIPAVKNNGVAAGALDAFLGGTNISWPTAWTVNDTPGLNPDILDGRPGGVPDPSPSLAGPTMIQIGSEGGVAPAPVYLVNTPVGYEMNKRSVTVLNVLEHTLFMGPAERADIIVDFSAFAGKTVILYNDSPAPVPAGDPRYDYYTGSVDMTPQGGAPPTVPGFGPNMRTILQFRVAAAPIVALNSAALTSSVALAFANYQPVPIVPETAYNGAAPAAVATDTYSRIQDTYLTYTPYGSTTVTQHMESKTIQELFDTAGKMNATLGVELPFTTALIQTTIPYGFIDGCTEVIPDGATQIWKITHNGVDTHAIHFHLFNVQVINRMGWDGAIKPPWPNEIGWKDTVKMNPLEDIVVAFRAKTPTVPFPLADNLRPLDPTAPLGSTTGFTAINPNNTPITVSNIMANFGAEYTWHCHILGHEENDMMRPIMVGAAPPAPSGLTGVVAGNGRSITLTWQNNATLAAGYTIQRAANSTFTLGLTTFNVGPVTTYTDTTFRSANTPYYYQVCATSVVGSGVPGFPSLTNSSPFSNIIGPPAAIVTLNPVTQTVRGTPMVLTWTVAGNGQTGFTIQRATDPAFTLGLRSFNVAGTVTTYSDGTQIRSGTTYYYRVLPTNSLGAGAPSNVQFKLAL